MWNWYPPVGVFIGILALLGVLVPLFRDLGKIGPREKAIWTAVMFLLVGLEFRSLYLDRADHDKKESEARDRQLKGFKDIGDGITATIRASDAQFQQTMGQLKRTVGNTEPSAVVAVIDIMPATIPVAPHSSVKFNVRFNNIGNENATDLRYDGRIYLGKLDDQEAQKIFASQFNQWWTQSKHQGSKEARAIPGSPPNVFTFSQEFSDDEIRDVTKHERTFYYLIRIIYSDHQGRWVHDYCAGVQDSTLNFGFVHTCVAHKENRYPAPK